MPTLPQVPLIQTPTINYRPFLDDKGVKTRWGIFCSLVGKFVGVREWRGGDKEAPEKPNGNLKNRGGAMSIVVRNVRGGDSNIQELGLGLGLVRDLSIFLNFFF